MTTAASQPQFTVKETYYRIPSATRPDVFHTITETRYGFRCDCEAGQHGRPCWALKGVIKGLVKPTIKLSPAKPVGRIEDLYDYE